MNTGQPLNIQSGNSTLAANSNVIQQEIHSGPLTVLPQCGCPAGDQGTQGCVGEDGQE